MSAKKFFVISLFAISLFITVFAVFGLFSFPISLVLAFIAIYLTRS